MVEAKKQSEKNGEDDNVFGKFEVAATTGQPRQVARSINLPPSDIFNHALPNLTATVIEAKSHPSQKMTGQVVITALVESFTIPEAPFQICYDLPSGIGVMLALSKLTSSAVGMDKVSKPHVLSDNFALVPITGIVNFTVRSAKNGRNGTDLRPDDLPAGTSIEILRYVAESKLVADGLRVYASADSISIISHKPLFVNARSDAIMEKGFATNAVHRETTSNVCRGIGEGQHPLLKEWLLQDIAYLKPLVETLQNHLVDKKVGIGKPFEADAASPEALASIKTALQTMSAIQKDEISEISIHVYDIIDALSKIDVSSQRYPAFLQTASTPFQKTFLECSTKGGPMTQSHWQYTADGDQNAPSPATKLNFFTEAMFRAGKEPSDKSVGALEFNIESVSISMKSPSTGEWVGFVPKLKDGTAVCVGQLLQSAKRSSAPLFNVYDFYRLPMVAKELTPFLNILTVLKKMPLTTTKTTEIEAQPLTNGDWGTETMIDIASGVASVGVAVSREFAASNLCENEEVAVMAPKSLYQYTDVDSSGDPKPPSRPRFIDSGFSSLNCHEEIRLTKYNVSVAPKGATEVGYFAIYEGVSADVDNNPMLTTDPRVGDAHIKSKIDADSKFSTEKMVLYAIARAETRDQDDPPKKKAKTDADGSESD